MKIIAHRGASGEFPENSLLAFEQAIQQGADAIEFDVHYHFNSQTFIVIHDHYVEKTTNAAGHIESFSLLQLQQLSLGKQQTIPSLKQVLTLVNGRIDLNIELKTIPQSNEQLSLVVNALKAELCEALSLNCCQADQIIISSFDHTLLAAVQQKLPTLRYAALIAHNPLDNGKSLINPLFSGVNPAIDCITQDLVKHMQLADKKVWVYTVDKEEDIITCLSLGVDGIFTNYPHRSRSFVNKHRCKKEV